jgi:putative transposase
VNQVVAALRQMHKDDALAGSISVTAVCRWLSVPRSSAYYLKQEGPPRALGRSTSKPGSLPEGFLLGLIYSIIQHNASFGVRLTWACLKYTLGIHVNIKRVARLMQREGWTVRKRRKGGRPRVRALRSVADKPNQRWATDIALIQCGRDGWCAFVPILDCCTREVVGWELSTSWRAHTAERALESALINRFGYTRGAPKRMAIRHDNGLVFGSRSYVAVARDYGLRQEYITPYSPQENGLCERFIRTMKEECAWQHRFTDIEQARNTLRTWVEWYNTRRPHSALGYTSPQTFKQQQAEPYTHAA